jgi:uncharacterized metal-binding protein
MTTTPTPNCAKCKAKACRKGQDCFGQSEIQKVLYQDETVGKLQDATAVWDTKKKPTDPRLLETVRFAQELGCKKVGLAFCLSVAAEAKVIEEIFARHFEVVSVCCKTGGIGKVEMGMPEVNPGEIMCNPAGQADLMNKAGTELNILCGLCVGHDAIFGKISRAPVTTLFVKDRALKHNPAEAVYDDAVLNRVKAELETLPPCNSPV